MDINCPGITPDGIIIIVGIADVRAHTTSPALADVVDPVPYRLINAEYNHTPIIP
jgi:hypothetical protein